MGLNLIQPIEIIQIVNIRSGKYYLGWEVHLISLQEFGGIDNFNAFQQKRKQKILQKKIHPFTVAPSSPAKSLDKKKELSFEELVRHRHASKHDSLQKENSKPSVAPPLFPSLLLERSRIVTDVYTSSLFPFLHFILTCSLFDLSAVSNVQTSS